MTAPTRTDPAPRAAQPGSPGLARIPAQGGERIHCRHCQAPAPERLFRLVGTWSVVDGDPAWDCDPCTRDHLAEIESDSASARRSPA
jgi:hypothetical protein